MFTPKGRSMRTGSTVTVLLAALSTFFPTVLAFVNKAPPLHLPPPSAGTFRLQNCARISKSIDNSINTAPLAILFLDASSEFSRKQYRAFAHLAKHYPDIKFIGIESYSLSFSDTKEICESVVQPVESPAEFLLDRHDFFHNQYAYEFFAASPNEIVLYNERERFRYLPKMQSDLTRPVSHSWFRTALDELSTVVTTNSRTTSSTYGSTSSAYMAPSSSAVNKINNMYLSDSFDHFPGFMYEDGEVGRIMQARDPLSCESHCKEIGCSAFVVYGKHHCTFFASEPWAVRHLRQHYSNANLYIRRPITDVNATSKLLSGFLVAALILLSACGLFIICSKSGTKRTASDIMNAGEEMWQKSVSAGMTVSGYATDAMSNMNMDNLGNMGNMGGFSLSSNSNNNNLIETTDSSSGAEDGDESDLVKVEREMGNLGEPMVVATNEDEPAE